LAQAQAQQQDHYSEEKIISTLTSFYTTLITERNADIHFDEASLLKQYCTQRLIDVLEKYTPIMVIDYCPFTNAQDCDIKWLKSLHIKKDSLRNDIYHVSFWLEYEKKNAEIELYIVQEGEKYKIDNVASIIPLIDIYEKSERERETETAVSYDKYYDLHFNTAFTDSAYVASGKMYPWINNYPASFLCLSGITKDSLLTKLFLNTMPFSDKLIDDVCQRILLPKNKESNGSAILEIKGKDIAFTQLIIEGLDNQENIRFSDTLRFIPDTMLKKHKISFPLENIEMLNFRIYSEGESGKPAGITFANMDIMLGNKPINEYPVQKVEQPPAIKETNIFPINPETGVGMAKIEDIFKNRITGIGESVHKETKVEKTAIDLIMWQIKHNNCKLVIVEGTFELMLAYNRYLQDDKFVLDSSFVRNKDKNFMYLLNAIKDYNSGKNSSEKVKFYGINYYWNGMSPRKDSFNNILRYLRIINSYTDSDLLKDVVGLFEAEKYEDIISFFTDNREALKNVFADGEFESILHIMQTSLKGSSNIVTRSMKRDSVMFVNVSFLFDLYCKDNYNAVIYAHSSHVNPVSSYPAIADKPFGYYMREKFGAAYKSFLLTTGSGEVTAMTLTGIKKQPLQRPPVESIEHNLDNLTDSCVFVKLTPEFDKMISARFKGTTHLPQEFYPVNPYQRYDGIFFVP
jgi:erythromycin esterase-like protein